MIEDTNSISILAMLALREEIVALAMEGVPDAEIQVREDYHDNGVPFEGITLHDIGEIYDDGVIGLEDVAYCIAVTLVAAKTRDATVTTDWLPVWRERIRRRFQYQRVAVGEPGGVRHHNTKVVSGEPKNAAKFDTYRIQQLVIRVWNREPRSLTGMP